MNYEDSCRCLSLDNILSHSSRTVERPSFSISSTSVPAANENIRVVNRVTDCVSSMGRL